MKRCPNCNRVFEDDRLSFCLDDGTPLVREAAAAADSEVTLVAPTPSDNDDEATRVAQPVNQPGPQTNNQLPGRPTWNASQYQAPVQPFQLAPPQRRAWPWVLAIIAVLLVGAGVIVGIAVILPPLLNPTNTNRATPTPTVGPSPSPTRRPSPSPSASPSPEASFESDVPTDVNVVREQLSDLEDDWEKANVEADKDALDEILADEYQGDSGGKARYLQTITPHAGRTWKYSNLRVQLRGNRAVLTYHLVRSGGGQQDNEDDYTDSFIWRDHRWQATSSHAANP